VAPARLLFPPPGPGRERLVLSKNGSTSTARTPFLAAGDMLQKRGCAKDRVDERCGGCDACNSKNSKLRSRREEATIERL
jgi:hypothetical protein